MYKITLGSGLCATRYGIEFSRGVGMTDNARIAETLKAKGFSVEVLPDENITEISVESLEKMSDDELVLFANQYNIDLGQSKARQGIIGKIKTRLENE